MNFIKDNQILLIILIFIGALVTYLLIVHWFPMDFVIYSLEDNYGKANEIGDTIGGIISPLIALIAAGLTYLAFYIQKIANDEVRKQFKLQQFESQFYEMVRLHKENVNEIEIKSRIPKNVIQDNGVQLRVFKEIVLSKRDAFTEMVYEFELLIDLIKVSELKIINRDTIMEAYNIFFFGNKYKIDWTKPFHSRFDTEIPEDSKNSLKTFCDMAQRVQNTLQLGIDWDLGDKIENEIDEINIELFNGHSAYLSHYFRHLFHTVKFVVESNITYSEKMNYLRILRAQLSNQEQAMIFYNWLSYYGSAWEDDDNKYFTEYKMIHNLWHNRLYQDEEINKIIKELNETPVKFRKGGMFEITVNY